MFTFGFRGIYRHSETSWGVLLSASAWHASDEMVYVLVEHGLPLVMTIVPAPWTWQRHGICASGWCFGPSVRERIMVPKENGHVPHAERAVRG